jgi:putative DNA primase/helicase
LLAKRGSHPTELADLFGARLVASVEVEDGRRLAESLVKQLTGGDRIKARRMREDFWEFAPTHKVFLAANHKPVVRGTDHAIWRRIKLVPFDVVIPKGNRIPACRRSYARSCPASSPGQFTVA